MMPKKISTMLSHDPEVGVKCMVMRGFWASQVFTLGSLVSRRRESASSGARRTVRDSLPSYGSHRSRWVGCDEVPVGEETRLGDGERSGAGEAAGSRAGGFPRLAF